jgi:hypothetical protein
MEYNNVLDKNMNVNENLSLFSGEIHLKENTLKFNNDNLIFKKKKLIEISKNLTKIEYFEIFNIITEDQCQYSENKNGIFINLSNVTEKTIDKIFEFINFIKHKKEDLIKHEEYLIYFKKNITENIIDKKIDFIRNENDQNNDNTKYIEISDDEYDDKKNSDYLVFSSDEENDLENKISLKKKKTKYSGKKAKMIKSIKDSNDYIKQKNKLKKSDE